MNQNKPVIFWHIPKCAGTSLRAMIAIDLMNRYGPITAPQTINTPTTNQNKFWEEYNKHGWISMKEYIDFDNLITHPYTEDNFKWGFLHIVNNELWKYWLYNVKDKSSNKCIEVHMNRAPSDKDMRVYDHSTSIVDDLCINKIYKDFSWITMLRNPTERLISEYMFINKLDLHASNLPIGSSHIYKFWGHLPSNMSIEDYANNPHTFNSQTKQLIGKGYLGEYEVTEKDVDSLIDTMEQLDVKVGIKEMFIDSIKYYNKSLGFNVDTYNIPHIRKNNHKPEVNNRIRKIFKDNNKWDYKLYDYYFKKLDSLKF